MHHNNFKHPTEINDGGKTGSEDFRVFNTIGRIQHVRSLCSDRIKSTWGYTDLMPLIPIVDIGVTPLLQWLLIPPVLLWWMRQAADAWTSA